MQQLKLRQEEEAVEEGAAQMQLLLMLIHATLPHPLLRVQSFSHAPPPATAGLSQVPTQSAVG